MSRIIGNVSIDEIREFKYNLNNAREMAGKIQCGEEVSAVHLQSHKDGYFSIKNGQDKVAAIAILGGESVLARYSTRPSEKE